MSRLNLVNIQLTKVSNIISVPKTWFLMSFKWPL